MILLKSLIITIATFRKRTTITMQISKPICLLSDKFVYINQYKGQKGPMLCKLKLLVWSPESSYVILLG